MAIKLSEGIEKKSVKRLLNWYNENNRDFLW